MSTKRRQGLSESAFAALMGVSRAAVWKAARTGRITPNADGTFDPVRCRREWVRNTRLRLPQASADPRRLAAQTVRETYEARMAELKYRIKTGELVPRAQVRLQAFEKARRGRDILKNIGSRVGPVVAALSDPEACTRLIDDEVARVIAAIMPAEE